MDVISRAAAIDAIEHITSSMSVCVNTDECHGMKRMQRQAVIELANLPSAQPKKGKWIVRDNPGTGWYRVTCSECGEDVTSTAPAIGFLPNAKVLWDYCPWCGADMRGDADD